MTHRKEKIEANAIYDKKAYDSLIFRIRKDAELNADMIRTHAEARGESINGFLLRAVTETIERDNSSTK